jgi:6-phosphogluconolactonase
MNINRYTNQEEASESAAHLLVEIANKAVNETGKFTIALCGGSSPRRLYEMLAAEPFKNQIAWEKTFIFWGDERFVPPDDPENNARMARKLLLNQVPVPSNQILPIPTAGRPQKAAENYASTLASVFDGDFPDFDLILLGLGENGHTASLFPEADVLKEQTRWTGTVYLGDKKQYRITLTTPAINHAKNIIFLVFGANKADILSKVLAGPYQPQKWPAQLIDPTTGALYWYIDEAAAKELKDNLIRE